MLLPRIILKDPGEYPSSHRSAGVGLCTLCSLVPEALLAVLYCGVEPGRQGSGDAHETPSLAATEYPARLDDQK